MSIRVHLHSPDEIVDEIIPQFISLPELLIITYDETKAEKYFILEDAKEKRYRLVRSFHRQADDPWGRRKRKLPRIKLK